MRKEKEEEEEGEDIRDDPEFRKKLAQLPLRLSSDMEENLQQIAAIDELAFPVKRQDQRS